MADAASAPWEEELIKALDEANWVLDPGF